MYPEDGIGVVIGVAPGIRNLDFGHFQAVVEAIFKVSAMADNFEAISRAPCSLFLPIIKGGEHTEAEQEEEASG